jgi:hypothetical protein
MPKPTLTPQQRRDILAEALRRSKWKPEDPFYQLVVEALRNA